MDKPVKPKSNTSSKTSNKQDITPAKKLSSQNTIFVGNLNINTKKENLSKTMEKFGEIINIAIINKGDPKQRNIGVVEFASYNAAIRAAKNDHLILHGKILKISFDIEDVVSKKIPTPNRKLSFDIPEGTTTIFVGNLAFKTVEGDVKRFFESCGKIIDVRISRTRDGIPRGFCHVEFENENCVRRSLEYRDKVLNGREIRIECASRSENFLLGSYKNQAKKHTKFRSVTKNLADSFKSPTRKIELKSPIRVKSVQSRKCRSSSPVKIRDFRNSPETKILDVRGKSVKISPRILLNKS